MMSNSDAMKAKTGLAMIKEQAVELAQEPTPCQPETQADSGHKLGQIKPKMGQIRPIMSQIRRKEYHMEIEQKLTKNQNTATEDATVC